jgi:hypothetical protein
MRRNRLVWNKCGIRSKSEEREHKKRSMIRTRNGTPTVLHMSFFPLVVLDGQSLDGPRFEQGDPTGSVGRRIEQGDDLR